MTIDQPIIDEIIRRIMAVTHPDKVIMFGSAATGGMDEDSDIDLLVLTPRAGNSRAESVRLVEALRGLGYPFDVLVMASEQFEESKDVVGGIAYPAHRQGRVIYAAA